MLNHECQKTTVEHYLDPRILAAWCDANKISKDQLRQSFYMSEDLPKVSKSVFTKLYINQYEINQMCFVLLSLISLNGHLFSELAFEYDSLWLKLSISDDCWYLRFLFFPLYCFLCS